MKKNFFLKFLNFCGIPETSSSLNINEILETNLWGYLFLVTLKAENLEHN